MSENVVEDTDEDGIPDDFGDDVVVAGEENSYVAVPNSTVPKNPTISIAEDSLKVDAYVYFEVVNTSEILSFDIAEGWTVLDGVEGPNGGDVYYATASAGDAFNQGIIDGDEVSIADFDIDDLDDRKVGDISFFAYLIQSEGFDDAATAFETVFPAADD